MKKVINFIGRASYESPCCETLSLQAEGVVLTGSVDFNDYGLKDLSEESGSVINQSDGWN